MLQAFSSFLLQLPLQFFSLVTFETLLDLFRQGLP